MNSFKSVFSIKDLEHLTGIKAHTIRIWEKRYNLLQPERTDTNIRFYDQQSLQTLLNVGYLNENGYKISKIASLTKDKTSELVKTIAKESTSNSHVMNLFKLSMLNFDPQLFNSVYKNISKDTSFRDMFYDYFIPLLADIGVLWQTDTITPAHEHFISTLIRQKIVLHTEEFQSKHINNPEETFVLFLPDNEIHELGLMFLNLEIAIKGYNSIFLGASIPISSLVDILEHHKKVTFVSYLTIRPEKEELLKYFKEFDETLLKKENTKFWILGRMVQHIDIDKLPNNVTAFNSINSLVEAI